MKTVINEVVTEEERGKGVKFCRIRRITGYITGDINTWGTSKKHELKDRVSHI
jgi:anaerobic ribonucleoside-triphosphate reductase